MSHPTLHELTLKFLDFFKTQSVFPEQDISDTKSESMSFLPIVNSFSFTCPDFTNEIADYLSTIVNNAYIQINKLDKDVVDNGLEVLYIDIGYAEIEGDNNEPLYCITIDNPVWVRENYDAIIDSYNLHLDLIPLHYLRKENGNFVFGPFNQDELQMFIEHHRLSLVLYGATETFNFDAEPIYDEDDDHEDGNTIASYHNVHLTPDVYNKIIESSGLKPIADTMLKVTQQMLPKGVTELRMC